MAPTYSDLTHVLAGQDERLAIAVTEGGPSFTRQALRQAVSDFAARLTQAGVRPGDVVCLAFANTVRRWREASTRCMRGRANWLAAQASALIRVASSSPSSASASSAS